MILRIETQRVITGAALAQVVALALSGCKPIQLKSAKSNPTPSVTDCAFASCLKPGNTIALVGALSAEVRSGSGVSGPLTFPAAGILKGDQVFAFARVMYPKGTTGAKNTIQFQNGTEKLGEATTQFIGDDGIGNSVARLSTQFVLGSQPAQKISLRTTVSGTTEQAGTNGGLLVFRSMNVQDAFRPENQDKVYFAADFPDFDMLAVKSVPVSESPVKVVSGTLKGTLGQDIFLARSGTSWEVAAGKANACEGALITWQLSADDTVIATDGPYALTSSRPSGYSSIQAIYQGAGKALSRIDLRAVIKPGNAPDKGACSVDVGEPSTLSTLVFRRASDLGASIASARFLREMGTSSQKPGRFASNSSSPPIESIAQFSWEHQQDDALVLDVNLVLGAEDRVQQTKVLTQLNRAPDGLSSSVARGNIMSPDRPFGFFISDMAIDTSANPLTKFFITGMAVNADAKPVSVLESKIVFMHWRKLGAR